MTDVGDDDCLFLTRDAAGFLRSTQCFRSWNETVSWWKLNSGGASEVEVFLWYKRQRKRCLGKQQMGRVECQIDDAMAYANFIWAKQRATTKKQATHELHDCSSLGPARTALKSWFVPHTTKLHTQGTASCQLQPTAWSWWFNNASHFKSMVSFLNIVNYFGFLYFHLLFAKEWTKEI